MPTFCFNDLDGSEVWSTEECHEYEDEEGNLQSECHFECPPAPDVTSERRGEDDPRSPGELTSNDGLAKSEPA